MHLSASLLTLVNSMKVFPLITVVGNERFITHETDVVNISGFYLSLLPSNDPLVTALAVNALDVRVCIYKRMVLDPPLHLTFAFNASL